VRKPGQVPPVESPGQPQARTRSVYQSLCADIRQGRHDPGGMLPSYKILSARYGACYRTLKKHLDALADKQIIEPFGKHYRVSATSVSRRRRIILIASGTSWGSVHLYSPRTQSYLTALECECARNGHLLDIVPCDVDGNLHCAGRVVTGAAREKLLSGANGVIVWTTGIPPGRLRDLMDTLALQGVNVAILDEGYEWPDGVFLRTSQHQFRVHVSDYRIGEQAGRFLLGLGYERAYFVSPYHDNQWSLDRLEGMAGAFVEAGLPGAVTALIASPVEPTSTELPGFLMELHAQVYERVTRHCDDKLHVANLLAIDSRLGFMHAAECMPRVLGGLLAAIPRESMERTVLVGANDIVALGCKAWCEQAALRIPEDLCVLGFDDSQEAWFQKLTSYNFNAPGLMHELLLAASGSYPPSGRNEPTTTVDGYVVDRGSVIGRSRAQ
jgi:DNA-binding LacI/PurR family transcriptional regulator